MEEDWWNISRLWCRAKKLKTWTYYRWYESLWEL